MGRRADLGRRLHVRGSAVRTTGLRLRPDRPRSDGARCCSIGRRRATRKRTLAERRITRLASRRRRSLLNCMAAVGGRCARRTSKALTAPRHSPHRIELSDAEAWGLGVDGALVYVAVFAGDPRADGADGSAPRRSPNATKNSSICASRVPRSVTSPAGSGSRVSVFNRSSTAKDGDGTGTSRGRPCESSRA